MERHDDCLRHRSGGPHSTNAAIVTTDSSSNYFSLASKHFNTTSASELVLFSRFRANLSSPCSVFSRSLFLPFVSSLFNSFRLRFSMYTGPNRAVPSTRTSTARIISIVRAAIIHRAKKIIKCLWIMERNTIWSGSKGASLHPERGRVLRWGTTNAKANNATELPLKTGRWTPLYPRIRLL